jgi:hypothetical protein
LPIPRPFREGCCFTRKQEALSSLPELPRPPLLSTLVAPLATGVEFGEPPLPHRHLVGERQALLAGGEAQVVAERLGFVPSFVRFVPVAT